MILKTGKFIRILFEDYEDEFEILKDFDIKEVEITMKKEKYEYPFKVEYYKTFIYYLIEKGYLSYRDETDYIYYFNRKLSSLEDGVEYYD